MLLKVNFSQILPKCITLYGRSKYFKDKIFADNPLTLHNQQKKFPLEIFRLYGICSVMHLIYFFCSQMIERWYHIPEKNSKCKFNC